MRTYEEPSVDVERKCRVCGCTDDDCSQCIEDTGAPCCWIEWDLCSACHEPVLADESTWNTAGFEPEF